MFEFPLWNAHFLGVTALLMGLGAPAGHGFARCIALDLALRQQEPASRWRWLMAMLLRDYVRLNATRVIGTPSDACRRRRRRSATPL